MKVFAAVVGIALLPLLALGCKQGAGNAGGQSSSQTEKIAVDPSAKATVSFAKDVQSIFSKSCAFPGCHGVSPSAGMQLSEGKAYDNTVNVPSSEVPRLMRIKPGEPDSSYLLMKVEGRQTFGSKMPLTGKALTDKELQTIRSWIQEGAKKD